MNTLEKINHHKQKEVAERKALYPVKLLERSPYFSSAPVSLKSYLLRADKSGIIAEIKRRSPSKGVINNYVSVERTSIGYMQAGASALSVLTDKTFFGGSSEDLSTARAFNYCPILRKDFIVDEYQLIESKSIGADTVLLIAAILTKVQIQNFTQQARELGLEVLLELHDEAELEKIGSNNDLIGINNRDLKTMEINIERSFRFAELLPGNFIKVSESGIEDVNTICELKRKGYNGFLIGSHFMKQARPHQACREFINELRTTIHEAHK